MATDELRSGGLIGPYRLEQLLGRGGTGVVWRAFDTRCERAVALKLLDAGQTIGPAMRERFRLEAHAAARLGAEPISSAHVVAVHDWGEIDGRFFVDMRLVRGSDLARTLRDRPRGLGVARAVDLVTQVADGLDAAHRLGLIHRDVKPSNILLEPGPSGELARLVDFGLVAVAGGAGVRPAPGTPAYMAPELWVEGAPASVASDVYALGCVLYEMLTGRPAVGSVVTDDPAAGSAGHPTDRRGRPPDEAVPVPSAVDPRLGAFDAVLARGMAVDPSRRFPDAPTLATAAAHAARTLLSR